MSMTDPIADLLTRIRNGHMARHTDVTLPCCVVTRMLPTSRFYSAGSVRESIGLKGKFL